MGWIEARQISKSFSFQKTKQLVFSELNFQIQKGEFVTFLGPSGCGKSTLLRMLGGLDAATSGELQVSAKKKSFVFQEPRLLNWRNCLENTLLPLEISQTRLTAEDLQKAQTLLRQLGLQNAMEKFPEQLSGGMKMRNAVARSLIVNPDFLLLDEPFAALDETTRQNLQVELRRLFEANKWTVAFVTHSIEEACFLSDRILIFSRDRKHLLEHKSSFNETRTPSLRNEILFFEEVRKVRALFEKEAL